MIEIREDSLDEIAEPIAAADGGRDVGLAEFLVVQRGRRG
jgi:hypothetical protein